MNQDATSLTALLDTVEGCARLFGKGLFGNRRAKKFATAFAGASSKGIAQAYTLTRRRIGSIDYEIKAFSPSGAVRQETIAKLRASADAVPDDIIHTENYPFDDLTPLRGGDGHWLRTANVVRGLSLPDEGVFVFDLGLLAGDGDASQLAWAIIDQELCVVVIYDKRLV